jgi:hypothetical protein
MSTDDIIFSLVPLFLILAGVVIVVAAMRYRAKVLELVHRERVAMIERGMMPTELEPAALESQRLRGAAGVRTRSFSLGIVVVGLGFALMSAVGIAGQAPQEGVGVGGAIVIIGAAFIVRGLLAPQINSAAPSASTPPSRATHGSAAVPPPPPSDFTPR